MIICDAGTWGGGATAFFICVNIYFFAQVSYGFAQISFAENNVDKTKTIQTQH